MPGNPSARTAIRDTRYAIRDTRYKWSYIFGAGWHQARALEVPENITLLKLPAYAPELNRVENVRAYLRANKSAIPVFDSHEDILDKCEGAWNFFEKGPERITSITSRNWATVN